MGGGVKIPDIWRHSVCVFERMRSSEIAITPGRPAELPLRNESNWRWQRKNRHRPNIIRERHPTEIECSTLGFIVYQKHTPV
jgi:hypothetical protein